MPSTRALVAAIVLSTATVRADEDAGEPCAGVEESGPDANVPGPSADAGGVRLPTIESRRIERVTIAVEGEEGEHAEVTVTRDGVVRLGRSRRGWGGGQPVLRATVRRVRNPNVFFDGVARLCAESSFVNAPEDTRARFGMWRTLTIAWDGHSRTIAVGSPGVTRDLITHVAHATGIAGDGLGIL